MSTVQRKVDDRDKSYERAEIAGEKRVSLGRTARSVLPLFDELTRSVLQLEHPLARLFVLVADLVQIHSLPSSDDQGRRRRNQEEQSSETLLGRLDAPPVTFPNTTGDVAHGVVEELSEVNGKEAEEEEEDQRVSLELL